MPPPWPAVDKPFAWLPETVEPVMTSRPLLAMPPPSVAVLPEIVTLVSVTLVASPRFNAPPGPLTSCWFTPLPPVSVTAEIAAVVLPETCTTRLAPLPLMTVVRASAPRIDMLVPICNWPIVST